MISLRHFGPAGRVRGCLFDWPESGKGQRIVIQLYPLPSKSFLKYREGEVFLCVKTGKPSADSVCVCVHVFVFVIFSGLVKHGVRTGTAQQFPR